MWQLLFGAISRSGKLRTLLFILPLTFVGLSCQPSSRTPFSDQESEAVGVIVTGPSLVPDTATSGRLRMHDELAILEYKRGEASAPVRVFANELIVITRDSQSLEQLIKHVERVGYVDQLRLEVAGRIPGRPIVLIRAAGNGFLAPGSLLEALQLPVGLTDSVNVYPNGVLQLFANQDLLDPGISERQWAMFNPGTIGGHVTRADADADGAEALVRMRNTGPVATRDIVVAVLDTGIDLGHEALGPALWRNPHEIPGNGLDDDGNGFVDDVHGWNFADNTSDVSDWKGHGTHVSGIIAARRPLQPEKGMWGIAPFSKILSIKIPLRDSNFTSVFIASSAIYYAADLRADVINMSFGSDTLNIPLRDAIWSAAPGIHMVAAAGNDGLDLKDTPVYPCVFDRVICVISSTMMDKRANSSNYDSRSLPTPDGTFMFIAAPGDQILSTVLSSQYGVKSGTSMAAPLVAGTLAAVKSMHPAESDREHQMRLFGNADRVSTLEHWVGEGRKLNVYQAIYGPVVGITSFDQTPYCLEKISVPPSPEPVARWNNRPYANSGEAGVNGSFARPYTICNVEQLSGIRDEDLGRVFALRQHVHWKAGHYPIGGSPRLAGQPPLPFRGMLLGNGFSLYNMTFEGSATGGLIAHLGPTGQVLDLQLRNVNIRTRSSAGAVAVISEGRIVNVHVDGHIESAGSTGGLAGAMSNGLIDRSYFSGEVVGEHYAGGLVGDMGGGISGPKPGIRLSQARGVVRGRHSGGIAGRLRHGAQISDAYAWVHIPEGNIIGGIAGTARCGSRITSSYAQGILGQGASVGTLIGQLEDAHLSKSYASVQIDAGANRGGSVGKVVDGLESTTGNGWVYVCTGTRTRPPQSSVSESYYDTFLSPGSGARGEGKTRAELKRRSTFSSWFNGATAWRFEEDFMPVLTGLPRSMDYEGVPIETGDDPY